jgi:succinate dehydrogenase / fumarate reductase, membrane anchor subunit
MATERPPSAVRSRVASGNFELYTWFFMRVSGLLLIFLALGHLAFVHIINTVDDIDYAFVAARWATPFWRIYDLLLLWLALLHGLNGLRTVLNDYITRPGWRVASLGMVWVLGILFLAIGSIVIFTFQPVPH